MNILGIYIYNSTRREWYVGQNKGVPKWGTFNGAHEFDAGAASEAEELREIISGEDVTFTMAVLH